MGPRDDPARLSATRVFCSVTGVGGYLSCDIHPFLGQHPSAAAFHGARVLLQQHKLCTRTGQRHPPRGPFNPGLSLAALLILHCRVRGSRQWSRRWELWILKPREWFHPRRCLAESPLLLFGLFSPSPDVTLRGGSHCWADPEGAGLGCCSQGFHGGRRMQILRLSRFPCGPPRLCTLLHSVPRLHSKASYFCSLGALKAAGLSKVILQLIWRLRCAAALLPGRVSLGVGRCRDENVLPEVPRGRGRTP